MHEVIYDGRKVNCDASPPYRSSIWPGHSKCVRALTPVSLHTIAQRIKARGTRQYDTISVALHRRHSYDVVISGCKV